MAEGVILEGWGARISGARPDLLVDLGGIQGVIPHDEGALGMEDGSTRDIALLTRVGKPVCFVVTGFEELADSTLRPVLSRRQAQQRCQEEYLDTLVPGDIISARVTHLEPFGCFVGLRRCSPLTPSRYPGSPIRPTASGWARRSGWWSGAGTKRTASP